MDDAHGDLGPLLKSWRERRSPVDVGLPAGGARRAVGTPPRGARRPRRTLGRLRGAARAGPRAQPLRPGGRRARPGTAARRRRARPPVPAGRAAAAVRSQRAAHIPPSVQRLVARLGEVAGRGVHGILGSARLEPAVGGPARRPGEQPAASTATSWRCRSVSPRADDAEGSRVRYARRWRALPAVARGRPAPGVRGGIRMTGVWRPDRAVCAPAAPSSPNCGRPARSASTSRSARRSCIPVVGELEVDCDVFSVAGTDLRIVAYTVAAGSPEADKLDFVRVASSAGVSAPTT